MLLATPAFAQPSDAALTQTLINEIRALRQQLETTNITSQRVQIALYRLQSQTAIVNMAQQRLDAAHAKLLEVQNQRKQMASAIQGMQDTAGTTSDAGQKKAMQEEIPGIKAHLEMLAAQEGALQSAEVDAESRLRTEQARLSDLQSLLDRLDKALDELARPKQ
jgi:hypothetical protein